MGTLQEDLSGIDTIENTVVKNKVARFAYTEKAYNDNNADGVEEYDVNKEQNIPIGSASVMKVNETVLNKGYRAQASSITRMLMNHFLGRISYNLNKVNDVVSSFIKTVKNNLGSANGIATLDATGRIPYTQLPESAMEFKGTWDASTNTPTLTDGTGRNGNFYVVSVAGSQTFGGVKINFNTNDRIIYNGATSSWTKLSSGDVRTVNGKKPDATGNITLDAPDVNAVKTINSISPNETTGNINLESLSINGQSFNGSASVSVDTMKMIYGGTGATEAKGAEFNITADMESQTSDFTDTTKITCVQESPSVSTGRFFYSNASYLWNYIKGKISSVLGLTASEYGGTALNATNAEQAASAGKLTTARKTYVTLGTASTTETIDWSGDTTIPVSGTLPVDNGGTGATTAKGAQKTLLSDMQTETTEMDDTTEFVMKYGTPTDTKGALFKRSATLVWEYIKGKISSVLGLTATNYGGKASTAGTADKTVNDITIDIPYVTESGQYVIPLGNILEPTSTTTYSPYNWDITGFFSIIRPTTGHAGEHITFAAGHGYSHSFTTYAYLDEDNFTEAGSLNASFGASIKAFQYNEKWWLGLWINTTWQGYTSKMTITYSRGLHATPTCILYNSKSGGVANEEIYNSIQDIPSSWWRKRTIYNPTNFTQNITAPSIKATTKFVGNLTGNVTGNVTGNLTGNVTGNLTGNATSAYSAYSGMVHICSTARGTKEKTVSIPGFTLTQGACIRVCFSNGNTATRPTLNVNGTGAKEICGPYGELLNASVIFSDTGASVIHPGTSASDFGICTWDYGIVLDLYYEGSEWRVIGDPMVLRFSENSTVKKNLSILGNLQTSILE